MRIVKDRLLTPSLRRITALAVALTIATVAAAGSAYADEPKPAEPGQSEQQKSEPGQPDFQQPDEFLTVDVNLLGCSFGAGLGADLLLAMGAGGGSSTNVNSGLVTRLKLAGCLPWEWGNN
ncbi:hypothetical protein [Nocardia callitridis]|uniref:Uncharacterized protein n=1 Tax=Nocardia callitridis TaxID=648753 RepID=A0ABP9K3P6_9NOCA